MSKPLQPDDPSPVAAAQSAIGPGGTFRNRQSAIPDRYHRQTVYANLGLAGQRRLASGAVLIVGVGALGCAAADALARAGVGRIRLVDDDVVTLENLHRQTLFDEADAAARTPKVLAAQRRLARVNGDCRVETAAVRLTAANAAELADGMDLVVDGTDNFATRFVINDLCVRDGRAWVFAGVVGAEAQTMTIVPGRSACLRCVFDAPPPVCQDPTCRSAGVLGPAVMAISGLQSMEALKILAGRTDAISPYLTKFDLWTG